MKYPPYLIASVCLVMTINSIIYSFLSFENVKFVLTTSDIEQLANSSGKQGTITETKGSLNNTPSDTNPLVLDQSTNPANKADPFQISQNISVAENSYQKPCEKVKQFVLIKTEKTGSSTLFSILARFIVIHRLNVMVMTKGGHLDVTKNKGERPGWDIGPRADDSADCLIHHSRYNESLYKYISKSAKFITLVREPESWFSSAVRFWPGQFGYKHPEEVIGRSDLLFSRREILGDQYNGQKTVLHLSQLQWLGFNYSLQHDINAIKKHIELIVPRFDIRFISDQFDASLIMMKRKFCWDHLDILYASREVGGRGIMKNVQFKPLSKPAKERLLSPEVNLGEQLLYEAFNNTWWNQEEVHSTDFWMEVNQFKKTNSAVNAACMTENKGLIIPPNRWSERIQVDHNLCQQLFFDNYKLLKNLATYAIGERYDQSI